MEAKEKESSPLVSIVLPICKNDRRAFTGTVPDPRIGNYSLFALLRRNA
jgi:hypothetical protein